MKYRIGFIGYGKMARAIAKYLAENNCGSICASDPAIIDEGNVNIFATNAELAANSDIVFLSIKPQNAREALFGIDFENKTVISIMAGLPIGTIRTFGKNMDKVVRVMPNLCASIGKSVNAFTTFGISDTEKAAIVHLLNAFGTAYEIDEGGFDTITGLTGSGPAYVFRFIKNIVECGEENGFSFSLAKNTVLDMLEGSADLLRGANSIAEMQTMIDNVCSKGGTTIEGIHALDEGDFDKTVKAAVIGAIRRSKELGKQ